MRSHRRIPPAFPMPPTPLFHRHMFGPLRRRLVSKLVSTVSITLNF